MISFLPEIDRQGKTRDEFYLEEKERYTEECYKAFESQVKNIYSRAEYAYIAAGSYIDGSFISKLLFQRLGLQKIHAYAVSCRESHMQDFTDEIDAMIEENAGDAT